MPSHKTPPAILRSTSGAFDLPSILIGVAVVAILAVGVVATIFGAVPWAQNRAAAQDLAALTTAQGTAKAKDDTYAGPTLMGQLGYLSDESGLDYAVSEDGSCWVGVTQAKSGKRFYTVNGSEPAELTRQTSPDCLDGPVKYQSLSSGGNNTCGISSGALYCWGYNGWGLTGNGATGSSGVPVQVKGALAGKTVAAVYSGEYNRCAVDTRGKAYCWGNGAEGQLGNGTKADSRVPVAVAGGLAAKQVTVMSNALQTTCAVADQKLYCWGEGVGAPHTLGDTSGSTASALPVLVDSGALSGVAVASVSVGNYHICALSTAGKAFCWGIGSYGALGTGNSTHQGIPVAVDLGSVAGGTLTSIEAGEWFTCAAGGARTYCWGNGADGRTGDGKSSGSTLLPREVTALAGKTVTRVSVTVREACARDDADGAWYCWGKNAYGQLGSPAGTFTAARPIPSAATPGAPNTNITLGMYSLCSLEGAAAYCMGYNVVGELGSGTSGTVPGFLKVAEPAGGKKTWVDTVLDGGRLP